MSALATTVRFAGFGGQGIIKAGEILGLAAIADGKRALQNQSYGSSARGGLCTSDITISAGEIYEIEPEVFDVLVVLSQDSCDAFLGAVSPGGIVIYEQELVRAPATPRAYPIAATRIAAQELGRQIVTNMVMLGCCAAVTELVRRSALEQTVAQSVPRGTEELNLRAIAAGWRSGESLVRAGGPSPSAPE
jgi:2-oxoglutarate ferredoxin oxidoreductase subunit gamma